MIFPDFLHPLFVFGNGSCGLFPSLKKLGKLAVGEKKWELGGGENNAFLGKIFNLRGDFEDNFLGEIIDFVLGKAEKEVGSSVKGDLAVTRLFLASGRGIISSFSISRKKSLTKKLLVYCTSTGSAWPT